MSRHTIGDTATRDAVTSDMTVSCQLPITVIQSGSSSIAVFVFIVVRIPLQCSRLPSVRGLPQSRHRVTLTGAASNVGDNRRRQTAVTFRRSVVVSAAPSFIRFFRHSVQRLDSHIARHLPDLFVVILTAFVRHLFALFVMRRASRRQAATTGCPACRAVS